MERRVSSVLSVNHRTADMTGGVAARYHFVTTTVELEFISRECPSEIEGSRLALTIPAAKL